MVEVAISQCREFEGPKADIVERLVVNAKGFVQVLNKLVDGGTRLRFSISTGYPYWHQFHHRVSEWFRNLENIVVSDNASWWQTLETIGPLCEHQKQSQRAQLLPIIWGGCRGPGDSRCGCSCGGSVRGSRGVIGGGSPSKDGL